jgi:hypothetical protein
MGTKQPRQPFIDSLDRTFARYRRPDQLIHVFNRLNVRSDDTHLSFQISRQLSRAGKPSKTANISNTVILVSRARNTFRKSCDLAENQIRIGSPDEGFGIPIASV